MQGSSLDPGPTPPDLTNDLVSFVTPVIFDTPTWNHRFGDCVKQPVEVTEIGDTVTARFVSSPGDDIQGVPRKVCQTSACYCVLRFE
jgi:neutral ceramidase